VCSAARPGRAPAVPGGPQRDGSRGLGGATALALARRRYDVAITYRNKAKRAAAVAAELTELEVEPLTTAGDPTRAADRVRLFGAVAAQRLLTMAPPVNRVNQLPERLTLGA
jgi:NAD(P)-dependent dehydrogenase (short-subunit alcohol dehydrogenase family)